MLLYIALILYFKNFFIHLFVLLKIIDIFFFFLFICLSIGFIEMLLECWSRKSKIASFLDQEFLKFRNFDFETCVMCFKSIMAIVAIDNNDNNCHGKLC